MGTAMIRTTIRTVVSRPLAGVFAYLADYGNLADYEPWVTSIEATSVGPVRAGSSWRHTRVGDDAASMRRSSWSSTSVEVLEMRLGGARQAV